MAMKFVGGGASSMRRQNDSTEHQIRRDWSRWIGDLLGWIGEAITADETAMSICECRSKSILGRVLRRGCRLPSVGAGPVSTRGNGFLSCYPPRVVVLCLSLALSYEQLAKAERGLSPVVKVTEPPLCVF